MLGLELVNRRLVYFLPGSVSAPVLAALMVLHPLLPTHLPQPPTTAGAALFLWLLMMLGGMVVFALLRPRIRRHNRRRGSRHLFID